MSEFILSCESTVDIGYDRVAKWGLPILFYSYLVDGVSYEDDMGRHPEVMPAFYEMLDSGKIPQTAQINYAQYTDFFKPLLEKCDVLHITLGTGMTASYQNAVQAAEDLNEQDLGHKVVVIDSLCSCTGYGFLVELAAEQRAAGKTLDEVAEYVNGIRTHIHHQFYSTELKFYRRSGRMSGPAAALGTILNICPIMRLDVGGHIIAYGKERGKKKAIETTLKEMEAHCVGGKDYNLKCFVNHSNAPADAEATKAALEEHFPNLKGKVEIFEIGPIIASHCGPGTLAVFFIGDERAPA